MQIISGERRGAKLIAFDGQSVRPTAQRTREGLFNILLGGRFLSKLDDLVVLDLFAGSGALGLEAISRGARQAYFVEQSFDAVAVIKKNVQKLRFDDSCRIIQGDCLKISNWLYEKADVVFCDPPYDKGLALAGLEAMKRVGALSDDALIVIETRKSETLDMPEAIEVLDTRRYGMAALTFCRYR